MSQNIAVTNLEQFNVKPFNELNGLLHIILILSKAYWTTTITLGSVHKIKLQHLRGLTGHKRCFVKSLLVNYNVAFLQEHLLADCHLHCIVEVGWIIEIDTDIAIFEKTETDSIFRKTE